MSREIKFLFLSVLFFFNNQTVRALKVSFIPTEGRNFESCGFSDSVRFNERAPSDDRRYDDGHFVSFKGRRIGRDSSIRLMTVVGRFKYGIDRRTRCVRRARARV